MGALVSLPAFALPQNGTVCAGAATIQQTPSAITVNQYTDRAVVDWQSFNIAPNETAKFNQPSVSSIILNRIHDRTPSQIMGSLSANGRVVLVNPNGMVFGKDAKVDVAGLVATTADIANERFMHGATLAFDKADSGVGKIINQGSISAKDAGLVALVAPEVTNDGAIVAKSGKIDLASGTQFTLDLYGDKLLSVAVDTKITKKLITTNNGTLKAEGGNVLVTTAQAKEAIDSAINMNGLVDVSGSTGGGIVITGDYVQIGAGAILTADGKTHGGDIKVGGDYLGQGATPHAKTVTMENGARISANATVKGDGGRVILWSDEKTEFAGTIEAKGGPQGGNGGFIETSSKDNLIVSGLADASAPNGAAGLWLMDPSNVTIANGAGNDVSAGGTFNPATDNYAIDATTIQTALNNGTSVTITTVRVAGAQNGDITVSNGTTIAKTAGGDATLTLKADNDIIMTGTTISSTSGELNVTLWSDADNSNAGAIALTNTAITSNGGDIILGGGTDPSSDFAYGHSGRFEGIKLDNGDLSAGAGNISLTAHGWDDAASWGLYGIQATNASSFTTTSGNIALTGTGGTGDGFLSGVLFQNNTTATTATGAISMTGRGGGTISGDSSGIAFFNSSVTSTGVGLGGTAIALNGTGGSGGTNYNWGVKIDTSSVTTVDGDIVVTGTAGNGTGEHNTGVFITSAANGITSTGTGASAGNITVTGLGGSGLQYDRGLSLEGGRINTVDGDIIINATAGSGTTDFNEGIYINATGRIISTGTGASAGTVTIASTGGSGAGDHNNGIYINAGGKITSVDGDVSITSTGGAANNDNNGIAIENTSEISSTGVAGISLIGQAGAGTSYDVRTTGGANVIGGGSATGTITLSMDNYSLANLAGQTTGDIALQPRSAGTTVGVAGGAGTLDISNALLAFFTAGDEFIIGRTNGTGDMHVNTKNWGATGLHLRSSTGIINIDGAQTLGAGEAFTITSNADTNIGAAVTGTGILTLQTSSAATTMGIAGGAGAASYSAGDITNLGTGWSSILLGNTTTTGAMTVGANAWADPVTFRADPTGSIVISGNQTTTAASNAIFTFSGPTTLSADVNTSAATGGTQAILFNSAVTLGGATVLNAGAAGDITFASTLNGTQDLTITNVDDITFTGAVGGTTRLDDVIITNADSVSASSFRAASFTQTAGTTTTAFGGTGLDATGDISITNNGGVTGTYRGTSGALNSGAGNITATVTFADLDIQGSAATLSGGYIGGGGSPSQDMANLITINNIGYPALVPNASYTFAAYIIGERPVAGSGGGGGGSVTPPVVPPVTETPTDPGTPSSGGGDSDGRSNPASPLPVAGDVVQQVIRINDIQSPRVVMLDEQDQPVGEASLALISETLQTGDDTAAKVSSGKAVVHYTDELLNELGCGGSPAAASCAALR